MKSILFFVIFFYFSQLTNAQINFPSHFVEIKKDTLGAQHHFFISKYAVSVCDYKTYLDSLGLQLPEPPDYGWYNKSLPMVAVSYDDFMGYTNWLTDFYKVKFRAPTDLEWTIAAANQGNPMQKLFGGQPASVDFIWPNKYGISGMNGNVWEWTSTFKDNEYNMIRGGSYSDENHPNTLNVHKSSALHSSLKLTDVGFRLAIDAKEMNKFLFATKVNDLLKKIFPEYTNLGVDAVNLYINDGQVNWGFDANLIKVYYKKRKLQFCCIDYLDDEKNTKEPSTIDFYFAKEDIKLVEKLKEIINNRDISLFEN